ncbi:MAG: 2-hydroxychromene-2-carboxylate isomerase [Hyphomicrobiaceae bacterium]
MSARADTIEFWFDFASGYAYFAHFEIGRIEQETGCAVLWRPYMLGSAFKVTGAQGLSATPMKGDYARRDWQRLASRKGVEFRPPANHPVVALAPSRIFYGIDESDPVKARAFAEACFRRYFGNGEDITNEGVLLTCLYDSGAKTAHLAAAEDSRIKAVLKARSEEALQKGVFGSPFFIWRDEPFWGADRVDMLIDWVRRNV